jgi:hypothetical protein
MATDARTSNQRWVVQLLVLWGIQLVDVLVVTSVTPAIPAMLADTGHAGGRVGGDGLRRAVAAQRPAR